MNPSLSVGVLSQRYWPEIGLGPLDDCWVLADLMALHGVAPWSWLRDVAAYRKAAGVPDTATGSEGGSLEASLRAVRSLYPPIAAMTRLYRGSWAGFDQLVRQGRTFSGSVLSASLPADFRFGFSGRHRIAGGWADEYRVLNPLDTPHSKPRPIAPTALRKAFADYPDAAEVNALVFPTVAEAFATHPLFGAALAEASAGLRAKLAEAHELAGKIVTATGA